MGCGLVEFLLVIDTVLVRCCALLSLQMCGVWGVICCFSFHHCRDRAEIVHIFSGCPATIRCGWRIPRVILIGSYRAMMLLVGVVGARI